MKTCLTYLFLILASQAFTQSYDIYVSDAGNFDRPPWQILKFDENGQNATVFINSHLAWPQDILFLEDEGTVLISNLNSGTITKHRSEDGEFISNFITGISGPTRMKFGPDSLLYILQWSGDGKVLRYRRNGDFVDVFTHAGVPGSIGLDWDTDDNLYVSSYGQDKVQKFGPDGSDLGVFIDSDLVGPTNIWFDSNGDLLVSDYDGTAVKRFNKKGGYLSEFLTGLSRSEGVAYLPNGDILIGNGATSSVKQFSSSGTYIKDIVKRGSGGLMTPNAVILRERSTVSSDETSSSKPIDLKLLQNYPNPFNPATKIQYELPEASQVTLAIYDLRGQLVRSLVNFYQNMGQYHLLWDGMDQSGNQLGAGVYICRIETVNYSSSIKIVYLP